MKRQVFRLGSVLRFYELQKQRSEMELLRGLQALHELDLEIARLTAEIAGLAELVHGDKAALLSTNGWIACYRKVEYLDRNRAAVRQQRQRQAEVVADLRKQRKRWAVAEETLLHLRKSVIEGNRDEAIKAEQVLADENELRRLLNETNE
jgi:hypothetical protein